MIDTALIHELKEIISINFKSDEINQIGKSFFKNFDLHQVSGTRVIQSLNTRKASSILVDYCDDNKLLNRLIEFLIQIDGSRFMGRVLEIKDIEVYLSKLAHTGMVYNSKKRKIVPLKESIEDAVNWGVLKEGKLYPVTVTSIDITGNSDLVKKHGARKMQQLYAFLWAHLKAKLQEYNGRIWSWAGDGGLVAFTFKDHIWNAVKFAIEIQATFPLFFAEKSYPIKDQIELRFGLDTGKLIFQSSTGSIVSEVINYACHIEKKICEPGRIAVSENVYRELGAHILKIFKPHSTFEGQPCYISVKKIDSLLD